MKISLCVLVSIIAIRLLSGCSSGSSAPTPPPAAAINGLDTPKSVSVVTAK